MARIKTTVTIPAVSLPKLTHIPRNPPGWGVSEISLTSRGSNIVSDLRPQNPAGEIPGSIKARYPSMTLPEWGLYWACLVEGFRPGEDFIYQAKMPGVGADYYSTLDFLFSRMHIGIDIQGAFWHYGQGSDKIAKDMARIGLYEGLGVRVIFIDEEQANASPRYYLREALAGRDHSRLSKGL